MNIDMRLSAAISKLGAVVKVKEGVVKRTCRLTLARVFDVELAAALGSDAKKTLRLLELGALAEATLPIDALVVRADLKAMNDQVRIEELRGITAKGTAADPDEGGPPTVQLVFEFDWAEGPWVFLGRNLSAQAEIELQTTQLRNPLADWRPPEPEEEPITRKRRKGRAEA